MWTLESSTGRVFDATGKPLTVGYSGGNCGRNPEGINNPAMQAIHNIGPIPEGLYTISKAYHHPLCGALTMDLTPDPANTMFGRSGFKWHGDTLQLRRASEGCLVTGIASRLIANASPDRRLQVVSFLPPSIPTVTSGVLANVPRTSVEAPAT